MKGENMNRLNLSVPEDDVILNLFDQAVPRGSLDEIGQVQRIDVVEYDSQSRQSLVEVMIQRWVDWP